MTPDERADRAMRPLNLTITQQAALRPLIHREIVEAVSQERETHEEWSDAAASTSAESERGRILGILKATTFHKITAAQVEAMMVAVEGGDH